MTLRFLIRSVSASLAALLFLAAPAQTQTADALNQIRKIYVDTFSGKLGGAELQQRIINSLHKDSSLEVVADPSHADAVLKGTGESWVRAYISVSPRASANTKAPVYGGYLSAQITGKDGETLWSYLVTPSRYSSSEIRADL